MFLVQSSLIYCYSIWNFLIGFEYLWGLDFCRGVYSLALKLFNFSDFAGLQGFCMCVVTLCFTTYNVWAWYTFESQFLYEIKSYRQFWIGNFNNSRYTINLEAMESYFKLYASNERKWRVILESYKVFRIYVNKITFSFTTIYLWEI